MFLLPLPLLGLAFPFHCCHYRSKHLMEAITPEFHRGTMLLLPLSNISIPQLMASRALDGISLPFTCTVKSSWLYVRPAGPREH